MVWRHVKLSEQMHVDGTLRKQKTNKSLYCMHTHTFHHKKERGERKEERKKEGRTNENEKKRKEKGK